MEENEHRPRFLVINSTNEFEKTIVVNKDEITCLTFRTKESTQEIELFIKLKNLDVIKSEIPLEEKSKLYEAFGVKQGK